MKLSKKTMELLLTNYVNINNGLLKPCAEKEKFTKLISDLELKIKSEPETIVYVDGLTALEFAKKLASEANERNKTPIQEKSWARMNEEETKSSIIPDPDIDYISDEWCSCGHKKIDCDCKAGCKCECNKRFLGAY
tara:strand:+ start:755 stop:1162 length:408 start_codon:yes stop_codon:yes gene_type:complete